MEELRGWVEREEEGRGVRVRAKVSRPSDARKEFVWEASFSPVGSARLARRRGERKGRHCTYFNKLYRYMYIDTLVIKNKMWMVMSLSKPST